MVMRLKYDEYFPKSRFRVRIEYSSFPEHDIPLHNHEFAELVIVRHGRGIHIIAGQRYAVEAGDVFFIRPDDAHQYRDMAGLDLCNILIDPVLLVSRAAALQRVPGYHALFHLEPILRENKDFAGKFHLFKDDMRFVYDLLESMEEEIENERPACELMAYAYLDLLLGFLARRYTEQETHASHTTINLSRVVAFIDQNYQEQITLDQLADVAHMSKSSLGRAFMRYYNATPVNYLIHHRIKKAIELLRDPMLSVTEVALNVGFSDSNYFCRRFHLLCGCSPREYRKRLL